MTSNYLIYALLVVGIFTVYMALVHVFRRDRMRDRVKATGGSSSAYIMEAEETPTPPLAAICGGFLKLFGVDVKNQKPLAIELQRAGIESDYAVNYYLTFKYIFQPIMLLAAAYVFLHMFMTEDQTTSDKLIGFIIGGLLALLGFSGASLYIKNRKQHRQQKLLFSFPEMLDLLLVCIESGLGLDAAFNRVSTEMKTSHPEIAYEIDRTRLELTILSDRSQALQNLAERCEIVPVKSLVASLIQTEKFGTSLVDTLRVLSDDQRVTRLLNAENRAARIPVLITIPLIICTLPALFIVILGPPFIRIAEQGGIFGREHTSHEK